MQDETFIKTLFKTLILSPGVKFTRSMAVNSMFKCKEIIYLKSVRSFSNCKIGAILAHDSECIYVFKL